MPELHFKGKEFVYNHHLTVPYSPLVADHEKSIGSGSLDDNLIIHGDNLNALKALLPRFADKVDCVFIDPPYNTGNESWSYNDNVNSPMMRVWLSLNPVNKEDMLRHDKWCCMMWPRLKMLHELLAEDGTFWMTISDHEVARARLILDEIFGEDNFLATVCWQKKYATANDTVDFSDMHDFIIVYAKSRPQGKNGKIGAVLERLERTAEQDKLYTNPDNDPRGPWKAGDYTCNKSADERPNLYFPLTHPRTRADVWPDRTNVWRFQESTHDKNTRDNCVWWGINQENTRPSYKRFLSDVRGKVAGTWWSHEYAGHTDEAKKLLQSIFSDRGRTFPTPKPLRLLMKILELATDESSLVLDSFAGSGTTAHAVLALNAKDGGERRFILIEGEDYADTETAERMRRVINGYAYKGTQREELLSERLNWSNLQKAEVLVQKARNLQTTWAGNYDDVKIQVEDGSLKVMGIRNVQERAEGLGGSFTYCTLGEPMNVDQMLLGNRLPDRATLGSWLFHTATGESLPTTETTAEPGSLEEWYLAESREFHVWLIYRPDLDYIKSRDTALTLDIANQIAASRTGKKHLVFAPARYAPNKVLLPLGVEYAPIPFALYRIEKG